MLFFLAIPWVPSRRMWSFNVNIFRHSTEWTPTVSLFELSTDIHSFPMFSDYHEAPYFRISSYLPSSVKQWKYHHLTGSIPKLGLKFLAHHGGVLSHGASPSPHPFSDFPISTIHFWDFMFGFSNINHPAIGAPPIYGNLHIPKIEDVPQHGSTDPQDPTTQPRAARKSRSARKGRSNRRAGGNESGWSTVGISVWFLESEHVACPQKMKNCN